MRALKYLCATALVASSSFRCMSALIELRRSLLYVCLEAAAAFALVAGRILFTDEAATVLSSERTICDLGSGGMSTVLLGPLLS